MKRFCIGNTKRKLLVTFLSLSVSACMTAGPDFVKPEADISQQWLSEQQALSTSSAEFKHWWKVFNDPVLNQLIDTAYQENLDLQIAAVRIFEARAQLGIAVGNQYPQTQTIGGSATQNNLSDHSPNISSQTDTSFGSYQVGFDAAW